MYYAVKPEEGGSVAHVTTPDLVHWERQEPVIHPDEGCRFDGGSVIEHEGELAMYYSHRCCELYDCPTAIRRATSTDGFVWTAREEPLLRFDAAPFLTYPYVVYEAARGRFVMVMGTGELPDRLHFYHSTDGIAWVAGGNKPSAADATGRHYLTHIGGESWMLRYRELYDIGTLNDDAVFEIDVSSGVAGTGAIPVHGHPDFDQVEMARMSWNNTMGLPIGCEMRTGTHPTHPGDYPHCDWLPAVKDLILIDEDGTPNDGFPNLTAEPVKLTPSSVSEDGLYHFSGTVGGLGLNERLMILAYDADDEQVLHAEVSVAFEMLTPHIVLPGGQGGFTRPIPLRHDGDTYRISVFFDSGVIDINLDGTIVLQGPSGRVVDSVWLRDWSAGVYVLDGWTLDPVAPISDGPPTTTTTTDAPITTTTTDAPITTTTTDA
eukprot:Polyplicarium_translucidae@DN2760_c0_g2_i3.p1